MKCTVTAEAFGCESPAHGRVLLASGVTDTVGSVKRWRRLLTNHKKPSEQNHDWVSNDRLVYKFGDAMRKQALFKVRVKVQPGGHVARLHVYAQETEGVPVLLSVKSLTALGAVINFETGHAIFSNLEPETVVQLERSPTGQLWMDLFEHMPVVSDNPLSLLVR